MFHQLKKVLLDRLRQQGIGEAVEAAAVVQVFKDEVVRRWGESNRNAFRKLTLRGNTLEVALYSSAFASELKMAEMELQDALTSHFNGKVYRLRIFG
ncbi:MAG: DciA family protein [Patescibacteria group bacterium]